MHIRSRNYHGLHGRNILQSVAIGRLILLRTYVYAHQDLFSRCHSVRTNESLQYHSSVVTPQLRSPSCVVSIPCCHSSMLSFILLSLIFVVTCQSSFLSLVTNLVVTQACCQSSSFIYILFCFCCIMPLYVCLSMCPALSHLVTSIVSVIHTVTPSSLCPGDIHPANCEYQFCGCERCCHSTHCHSQWDHRHSMVSETHPARSLPSWPDVPF